MMKKILGILLIALPAIGIFALQVWASGWLATIVSWVFALIVATMIAVGIHLTVGE